MGIEIICVDGASQDRTQDLIQSAKAKLLKLPDSNRAQKINLGISQALGEWIVVVHPRSFLSKKALGQLFEVNKTEIMWGAWTHSFDHSHFLLNFTSWYSNFVRGDLSSIYYLDHCFFIQKSALENVALPLFPEVEIFEDTEVWIKLRKVSRGQRLSEKITTSAVRFKKTGIFSQSLLNQKLKLQYWLGRRDREMNARYEKNLELNQKVKSEVKSEVKGRAKNLRSGESGSILPD